MVLKPLVKPELNIYVHIEKVINSYNTDRVNIWALYSVSNDFCLNSIPDIVKMSPLLIRSLLCMRQYICAMYKCAYQGKNRDSLVWKMVL